MFCPSCGFEYTQKTNYCKRCGAELNAAPQTVGVEPPRFRAGGIFFVVALFGAVGLFMNLISYHVLIDNPRVNGEERLLTFALGLLLVGGIAGFLIRQLSRLITGYQRSNQAPAPERIIIREVPAVQPIAPTGQIPEAPKAVGPLSVVEHTTRQMAGVYGEPKAMK